MKLFRWKRKLIARLLTFVFVILGIGLVGWSSFVVYRNEQRFRLDPLDEYYNLNYSIGNFVFDSSTWILGDSRANQWARYLNDDKSNIVNLGINGQSTLQVRYRFEQYLSRHEKPTVLVLQFGINDLKCIPLFEGRPIVEDVIDNSKYILLKCLENNIKAIYTAVFPMGDIEFLRRFIWDKTVNQAVIEVNYEMRKFCKKNGIEYVDAYSILLDNNSGKVKSEFQKDFLHINKDGYKALNKALNKFL